MEMEQEEVNFERARRLVRIAATAAYQAALALDDVDPTVVVGDPTVVVHQAVVESARQHLPGADLTILERAAGGGHHHHHRQHHHRQHRYGMHRYGLRHHGMRHHGLHHHHHAGQWHRQHGKIVLDGV
jgi:hypothetical protein